MGTQWGTSYEYPQHMFSWRHKKKYLATSHVWSQLYVCSQPIVWCKNNTKFIPSCHPDYLLICLPIVDWMNSLHYILEDSNFDFRYARLCDLDILRQKRFNYLQTVETLIRCHILQHLIWVCTVCQLPFYESPDYNGLTTGILFIWETLYDVLLA